MAVPVETSVGAANHHEIVLSVNPIASPSDVRVRYDDLPAVHDTAGLANLAEGRSESDVRWSKNPAEDRRECSGDLELPGLAANPSPAELWTLPVKRWLARQVTAHGHFGVDRPDHSPGAYGSITPGPDNEPLLGVVTPVGRLAAAGAPRWPSGSRHPT